MKRSFLTFIIFPFLIFCCTAQTGPGIGIYPTGTEPGIGFRSAKESKWCIDSRLAKFSFNEASNNSFITEFSLVRRVVLLEKVRFHLGLGYRGNWNFADTHKQGLVVPIGVEAFPFPFQNAGLIFEASPYFESYPGGHWNLALRTIAGFVFYFPVKSSNNPKP